MKRENVKTAEVTVDVIWFFGPRWMKPASVEYFADYDEHSKVTDKDKVERLRKAGVEEAVKKTALRYAPNGAWIDLPHSVFRPFPASTGVTLFDDEWLPIPPRMFGGE